MICYNVVIFSFDTKNKHNVYRIISKYRQKNEKKITVLIVENTISKEIPQMFGMLIHTRKNFIKPINFITINIYDMF